MQTAHVTPETLKFLDTPSGRTHGPPWLKGFHQRHWGVQNGAEVSFADGDSIRKVVCIQNAFYESHGFPFLVRSTYLDLWKHIVDHYLQADDHDDLHGPPEDTVVSGHPGIGKSKSLQFLMCAAAEAKVPFIFHMGGSSYSYVCLDAGGFFITADRTGSLEFTSRALVLIDSHNDIPFPSSAHIVLAASPGRLRCRPFGKIREAEYFTMSLPTLAEFRAILQLRKAGMDPQRRAVSVVDPMSSIPTSTVTQEDGSAITGYEVMDVDLDPKFRVPGPQLDAKHWDPIEVFQLCGPDLRCALPLHNRFSGNPLELLPWRHWPSALQAATTALRGYIPYMLYGHHTLFFELPDPSGPLTGHIPVNLSVPTPFLRGIVASAARDLKPAERLALFSRTRTYPTIRGVAFEAAALAHLSTAHLRPAFRAPSAAPVVIGPHGAQYVAKMDAGAPLPVPVNAAPRRLFYFRGTQPPCIDNTPGFCEFPRALAGVDALLLADGPAEDAVRYEILFQVALRGIKQPAFDTIIAGLDAHAEADGRPRRRVLLFVSEEPEAGQDWMASDHPSPPGWELGRLTVTASDLLGSPMMGELWV
ncbi:hypothetical protein AURDEDRAFT_173409 [Auricularia subglabra TFB-10046 SS5]|uniref:Uncharacterized protein n=1 Tax=Auricularia subglabra (strain TFB-10046 / SS5) TaxID=717982 RepID=J0LHJ0_AURST|nr:hypothetical protein AURDEDRAFT_173409 [Auricularia subglabra TFB-10046 SS5]